MPKVYLSEKDRLSARLAKWVYGEMKLRGMTQAQLAEMLFISQQALSKKLSRASFSYEDFVLLVKVFEPTANELAALVKG